MLNAVGKAQNILLLGGTSDIGLAIVQEFLSHGPARVTLAARLDSPRLDAAVRQVEQAGASAVEVIDFDAADTDSHPEVIDAAFANGDVDLAIVAFGTLGKNCGKTRKRLLKAHRSTTPVPCRWACCWGRSSKSKATAPSSLCHLLLV